MRVRIESAARLHMGFIDLHGGVGRRFGSIGVALEKPCLIVEAAPASELTAEGPDRERAVEFAERFYDHYVPELIDEPSGAHLRVLEAIPSHVGLGSGTQLALAVGTALTHLHGIQASTFELAQVMGRGRRSSMGIGAFQGGGFLVDGGRTTDSNRLAPIVIRRRLPPDWFFVVVTPEVPPGLSGDREDQAFVDMPRPSAESAGQIARLLVMQMLPALVENDIARFGAALTKIQRLVGDSFAPVQGGRYADDLSAQLIAYLLDQGALGAGQSSWGPTVYALVQGEETAQALEERVTNFPKGTQLGMYHSCVADQGAQVTVGR